MKKILKYDDFLKESISYEESLINKIKSVLSPDLLKGMWKKDNPINKTEGHCYIATEALYWLLGGSESKYKPFVLSNRVWPEELDEGETHWFLKNMIQKRF